MKIFTGNANPALAAKICAALGCTMGAASVEPFSDGEIQLQIQENVRGADVFVVQPTCTPVDRHLMELLLMIDALKRASAERITAVLPYYGYARQDRKDKPRVPISARLIATLMETAGADRVLTLDLHAAQIQGFFDVPVDHLFSAPVMIEYFESIGRRDLTVVSPDAGGVERARAFAKRLNAPLAIIDKRREGSECGRSDACHRRGRGTELFDGGRSDRYGRHAGEGRRSAAEAGRAQRHAPAPRMRCCRGRRWSGSRSRRLRKWWLRIRFRCVRSAVRSGRSRRFRWRRCWRRPFSRSTKRLRSAFCFLERNSAELISDN